MGISQYRLAKEIGVPPQRIGDITATRRRHRLAPVPVFRPSSGYWPRPWPMTRKSRNAP
jgi:hypothetical protein